MDLLALTVWLSTLDVFYVSTYQVFYQVLVALPPNQLTAREKACSVCLDASAFQMVGQVFMLLIIPFVSVISLLRGRVVAIVTSPCFLRLKSSPWQILNSGFQSCPRNGRKRTRFCQQHRVEHTSKLF